MKGELCDCGAELDALTDEAHAEDCPNRPSVRQSSALQTEAIEILELVRVGGPVPTDRARRFARDVLTMEPVSRSALAVLDEVTGSRVVDLAAGVVGVRGGAHGGLLTRDLLELVDREGLDLLVHAPRSKSQPDWAVCVWDYDDPRLSAIGTGPAFVLALSQSLGNFETIATADANTPSTMPPPLPRREGEAL